MVSSSSSSISSISSSNMCSTSNSASPAIRQKLVMADLVARDVEKVRAAYSGEGLGA